jgi:tRNA/rRNA methyltransferase
MTSIILVEPQMGENIGAAARAMLNFGFTDLRIVNPRDGWPNQKAIDMSAWAEKIVHEAKIFATVEEAIADLNFVYAATARQREIEKEMVVPREITLHGKTGIMFGRENNGLSNHEVTLCNKIVTIPVNPECKSINIATSVAIICYELSQCQNPVVAEVELATRQEVEGFIRHVETELDKTDFFSVPQKKPGMMVNFSNIFTRMKLTGGEVRTLRGVIRAIAEKSKP